MKKDKKQKENSMSRIPVLKTYKLYIGGAFPRTESGRYISFKLTDGQAVNVCRASRKDLRNAVVAARSALKSWTGRSAFNRSQILYRMAEMMEGRRDQFISDLRLIGSTLEQAEAEVDQSIDCIIHYAGWCDKYIQIFSSVNPVASAYFNFSMPEPVGVVGILDEKQGSLYSMVSLLVPTLAGANTAVMLLPPQSAPLALDFAEVLQTSDLPAGVVNILTGKLDELLKIFGSHLDIDAVVLSSDSRSRKRELETFGAAHVLRVVHRNFGDQVLGPYPILDLQEIKTTWHPIGQ